MKPMLCIFAHPDDEAFGPGGTIAKYARERDVYIICVTKGNGCKDNNPDRLAQLRRDELLKSASIMGVKKVDFLNYDDGTLCNNLYHEIALKIEEKVCEYKPDTLMTFDMRGVSGHIDHIAVSLITTFVFKKLDFVKKILYFCESREMIEAIDDYFIYMPPGLGRSKADLVCDISSVWDIKVEAMKAHKTQRDDCEMLLALYKKLGKQEELFLKLEK